MRDAEVSPGKPDDVLRIAFLGDSFTFAWGVEVAQGYADLLEGLLQQRLAAAGDNRRVEVLNFGVPGYNTATEVACLEHKALALKPDLILLQYFFNDAYLPNFLMPERPRPPSYLVEWVKDAMGLRMPPGGELLNPGAEGPLVDWRRDPSRVPPELAYMVGSPGIERALRRLVELAGQAGVRVGVVMISLPGRAVIVDSTRPVELTAADQEVRALCEHLALPVICTLEPTVELLRASGGTPLDLVLSEKDWHPNVKGHRFFAQLIADGICDAGLFPSQR
jgi:lysophospholipase L1-like esterase